MITMNKVDELPTGIEILAAPGENRKELIDTVGNNYGRIFNLILASLFIIVSFFVSSTLAVSIRFIGIMMTVFVLSEFLRICLNIASLTLRNPWVPWFMRVQVIIMSSVRIFLRGVTPKQLRGRMTNVSDRIATLRSYLEIARKISPDAVHDVMQHTRLLEVGPARMRLNTAIDLYNADIRARDAILDDARLSHCRDLVLPLVRTRAFNDARRIVLRARNLLAQAEQFGVKHLVIEFITKGHFDDAQKFIDAVRANRDKQHDLDVWRARILCTKSEHHRRLLDLLAHLEQHAFGTRDYRKARYTLDQAISACS